MSTKFSRPDKPKGKFTQSNINLVYRGNASEIQSKPAIRNSGYQVVGKLQGTRRNPPPPPWVPSIKAEMGGQDTKVNIVPPGGSGWGTGPSTANNESSSSPSKIDCKEKQNEASSSILKGITENSPQNNSEANKTGTDDSETPLVKPPQEPVLELRSKTAVLNPPEDLSADIVRPLSGKALAPMVPFYQRPSASVSTAMKDVDAVTDSSTEESKEESQSPTPVSKPVAATTRSSGWVAVASEEPDFHEKIDFSDSDDDGAASEDSMKESSRKLPSESLNEYPSSSIKPLSSSDTVSDTPWVTAPPLTTNSHATFNRAVWDQQPLSSFSSVSPMPPQLSYPLSSYCAPRNDGLFPDDMLAANRATEVALLGEQLQRASFTNNSEAQVQAQREERTLAYKSAVNRAQMSRKKRGDEQQSVSLEPTFSRNDQSMDSVKSGFTDVNVFPPSFMHPHGSSSYPTISAINHSPQHSVEPVFAALYSGGLPNMMGNGFVPPPPQAMKPQAHLNNPLSSSTWNPHSSFSASNNQPAAFMHASYPLSNSPKLAPPTNQGAYFKSDPFTPVYSQPPQSISKSEHPRHHSVESLAHSFANQMGGETSINHLTGFQPPSKSLQQHQSNSPVLDNRLDSESGGGNALLNSLPTSLGGHALQISTHADGTRTTAFTAPPGVDSSYPQTSNAAVTAVPRQQQPPTSHITPLMEVSLSGKWSEKDFEEVFENSSHGAYSKPFKSGRGGGAKHRDDPVRRYGSGFTVNTGRPPGGRGGGGGGGGAKRSIRPRPPNTESECEESYEDGRRQQYGTEEHDVTFSRSHQQQQRSRGGHSRGGGVAARSNRAYEEDGKQSGADYDHGERWKSSGYRSNRHGGESGGVSEKSTSIASGGSGFGRKNFSRSGPSNRRFDGNDGTSKSSPRGNFSAHQRKQHRESEDTAAGDYSASSQNDSKKPDTNPVKSDSEQPEGSTSQIYPSQRPHRGGGSAGRAGHRGTHSGSQRQAAQRRDHRAYQNQSRVNQHNYNPRRHPDDDNDNGTSSNSNNNAATSNTTTVTTTSADHSSTNKGDINGGGSNGSTTNESGGGQQHQQQQSGTVDSLGTGSSKSRNHAHSVTLASDVGDVWETASEGFSSSIMGTSPGCSFADCATVRAYDNDDNIIEHDDGYGKRLNTTQRGRRPICPAPNMGKIVPLMSINAEAPPSFVNNPNFLDSPPPSPTHPVQKPSTKSEVKGGVGGGGEKKDAVESNAGEEQSAAGSYTDSTEDGFQEVKSKSARRQQKAKQQQKGLKSSSSNDERSSNGKSRIRDATSTTVFTNKSRAQRTSKGISEQQKQFKSSATSKKSDEKYKQQQSRSANATTSTSSVKSSTENGVTKKALSSCPSKNPPPSAWLKPLQETINEKAAALAAAQQQKNAKSSSTTKDTPPTTSVVSSVGSVNSTLSITSSSYAWSVVVGSRTATTTSGENNTVSTPTTSTNKVTIQKPIQNICITTSTESKASSNQSNIAPMSECQSKTTTSTAIAGDKKEGVDGLPVSATATVVPSSTSAIVCKVLPQKQLECSNVAASSSVVTVAPSTRPESNNSFSTSNIANSNPVPMQPNSSQPLSFRRPRLSDVGDWLGLGKTNTPAALFFDSYNPVKKMDNTMSQEMNSLLTQHQQQSFRQQQQAMAPPQVINFNLHELTMRNHQGSLRDSYFTPFSGGGNNGSQQRNIYTPQQKGSAACWQPGSWQAPPPQHQAAHYEPSGLWPSNYSTPPPPPASYVGVIGADRPSTNNSVSTQQQQQQSRLQQQQQAAAVVAFAAASIYGRGGGGGGSGNGGGQQPYPQPQPQPGGLYAQSPSQQQTPPPHLSFDPNFGYSNGGLAANSTSVFSHHHHQSSGGPALLAPHQQRQQQLINSTGASARDHPHPPMFINAAAVSHGTPFPPPAAAVIPTPGLHY